MATLGLHLIYFTSWPGAPPRKTEESACKVYCMTENTFLVGLIIPTATAL